MILLSSREKNLLLMVGFVALWNSGFIAAAFGLPYTGTFTLLFYRYLMLTGLVFAYLYTTNQLQWFGWYHVRNQMLIGVLAHGVWLSCALLAIEYGVPAGFVALIVALQPLATGALSGVVVGESVPWNQWLGLVVGFSGVAIPVAFRIDFSDASSIFAWLLPVGSVVAITVASLFQRKISLKEGNRSMPKGLALFYQGLATTLVMAGPAVLREQLSVEWNLPFLSSLIWLTLGVSLGAYTLMWLLIGRIDATRVASLFYLGPPVTMLMAWAAFGDSIQPIDMTGLALVALGVFLTYMQPPAFLNRLPRRSTAWQARAQKNR
jgi:drug/metabolite transporter (DMT)-like permease